MLKMAIYKCSSLLDACLVTHLMAIKSDQLPYLALKYRQSRQISNSFNKYNVLALQAEISKGDPLYKMWSPLVLVPIYLLKEIVASIKLCFQWMAWRSFLRERLDSSQKSIRKCPPFALWAFKRKLIFYHAFWTNQLKQIMNLWSINNSLLARARAG